MHCLSVSTRKGLAPRGKPPSNQDHITSGERICDEQNLDGLGRFSAEPPALSAPPPPPAQHPDLFDCAIGKERAILEDRCAFGDQDRLARWHRIEGRWPIAAAAQAAFWEMRLIE